MSEERTGAQDRERTESASGTRALLIVDVQAGFIRPGRIDALPAAVASHVRVHRARYELVIATRFINLEGSLFERAKHYKRIRSAGEIALCPEIAEVADEAVDKTTYSSANDAMLRLLGDHRIARVDLCGISTDGCVLATALGLWDRGVEPFVLGGLCGSNNSPMAHAEGLRILSRLLGPGHVLRARAQEPR